MFARAIAEFEFSLTFANALRTRWFARSTGNATRAAPTGAGNCPKWEPDSEIRSRDGTVNDLCREADHGTLTGIGPVSDWYQASDTWIAAHHTYREGK
jgi:hypothetical protein